MNLQVERKKPTEAVLHISASAEELENVKTKTLKRLAPQVKVPGFREGKVPREVVEKNLDPQVLQTEFINDAVNELYIAAIREERLRPVGQPKVNLKKFVPFTQMDVELEIPIVGEIKLPDYKKLKAKKIVKKITAKDIDEVVKNLQTRVSEKAEVKRATKNGDEAWIDFRGVDKNGESVKGADGKDYPLALGSGTFIPGFEDNVVGMKPGDEKSFDTTFPDDYGAKTLQGAKVTFTVTLKKVMEVKLPKADNEFAAKVGPFKSVDELKADIRKQLEAEAGQRAERDWEAALVNELSDTAKVEIPEILISEQEEAVLNEVRQNAVQRGMTYQEFLESQGLSEEEFKKNEVTPEAHRRIKAGLLLSEIADVEGIDVTPEELEVRMQLLKGQYSDKQMQEQLDQPESRREINSRLRTEKVIALLKH